MKESRILIQNVSILDQGSPFHQKTVDVLLKEGRISDIGVGLKADAEKIDGSGQYLSLGFTEFRANFNDPGNEDRENLQTGAAAALNGGFTAVALSPQTSPAVDNKAAVEYLRNQSDISSIELLPVASFTKGIAGKELSEMHDMKSSGAIAFSHGTKAVESSALMKLALLYNREIGTPLQVLSFDPAMTSGGQMHEGTQSAWLGLKGIPDLSETLTINRDLYLAEYCEAPIHFQGISSEAGVKLIREAKAKGLLVSADVNVLNLIWNCDRLENYDSNLKVYPPLREESDRLALIEGLKDGTIDGIASDHRPRTIEEKRCEFDLAHFGAASLEASFAALHTSLSEQLGLEALVELLSRKSRNILNYRQEECIDIEQAVDLCLIDPNYKWDWDDYQPKSKAANYPFAGESFKGKVMATYSKGQWQNSSL